MRTILLLEDDENLNRGIALKLQKEGYQVFSAFQISEAEKLFDENRIDLVICSFDKICLAFSIK